jgi:hypothetical protein
MNPDPAAAELVDVLNASDKRRGLTVTVRRAEDFGPTQRLRIVSYRRPVRVIAINSFETSTSDETTTNVYRYEFYQL